MGEHKHSECGTCQGGGMAIWPGGVPGLDSSRSDAAFHHSLCDPVRDSKDTSRDQGASSHCSRDSQTAFSSF